MNVLTRVMKAVQTEITKPDTYVKGDEFEDFIRRHIFPRDEYDLLARTPDYAANEDDFNESSTYPDFKFRSRRSGYVFYVEAKYRSAYFDGAIEWCKLHQMSRYEAINRSIPVYVVIGVGNSPSAPEQVFLLPVKRARYLRLFRTFLKEFEIPGDRGVGTATLMSLRTE